MAIANMESARLRPALKDVVRATSTTPAHADLDALTTAVVASTLVTSSAMAGKGGVSTPVYNLFLCTGAATADDWHLWAKTLRSTRWLDSALGQVSVRQGVQCTGCHSCDHHYWDCPFMRIPGWHGVLPKAPPRKKR